MSCGSTYKKTIPSGGGAVAVFGRGVRLFGSDEEREEGIVFFYYMCAPHDISYVEKIQPTWQSHGQQINGYT